MVDKVVIIGGSAGGLNVAIQLLEECPADFPHPIVIVLHRGKDQNTMLTSLLGQRTQKKVIEVEHYDKLENGKIYIAPADYHLLVGSDHHLELDFSEKVLYSRPSIDVSFTSFAHVFKDKLIGVVLSGANKDGAQGAKDIIENGGVIVVQKPDEAEVEIMPQETIDANPSISHIVPSNQIIKTIIAISNQ